MITFAGMSSKPRRPPGWFDMTWDEQDADLERRGKYLGCPVCKQEVRFSCYHDGQDCSSVELDLPVPPGIITLEFTEEELDALCIEFFPRMTVASIAGSNRLVARALYEIRPSLLPYALRCEVEASLNAESPSATGR